MPTALDTLEIAKRLRGAGFSESQAEAVTGVVRDAREADMSQLATKADLSQFATKTELFQVEAALKAEIVALKAELEILRRDLTIRLGGMIAAAFGILLAAKFFG